METKITLQKNILTQNAIKVDEVTYRYNWTNEKILEDEREEKTFNSLEELKSYVSTFTPLNQRLYREAKKKKLPYYLMKQLENK
jgi:predicted nucleic acid-binding OB-fold protein